MYITTFLEKTINGDYDFCGVCFKDTDEDQVSIDDEVIIPGRNSQEILKTSEIISCVLGNEVLNNVSTFQSICSQCVASAVSCYKFITRTRENARYAFHAIESLTQSFKATEDSENIMEECETLFVSLDPDNLTVVPQYYSNLGPMRSKHEAFEKLLISTDIITKKKRQDKDKQYVKLPYDNKVHKNKNAISTIDMVHNRDMSVLSCKDCLKEFLTVSNLRNHFLRLHAPKRFKCSQCSKTFGTQAFLNAHEAESHINMICSECGKTFTNLHTFRNHEKTHYMKIICPDCGRVYKNQNTYKKHFDNNVCQTPVRHSFSDAKFTCDYCGKKYTQKVTLRVHIQYEHLNYKYLHCKWCDKKFWCQARLKAHIVTHTKEKNFICTICNGKFVTRESLLYHTRIHTGEKPYACHYCDSRFLSASRRQAHMKSQHEDDPKVECDVCHAKFKSFTYLVKHKLTHDGPRVKIESICTLNKGKTSDIDIKVEQKQEKSVFARKIKNHELVNERTLQPLIVYKMINENDEYKSETDHNNDQETIYLEMTDDDGQYDLKVPIEG